MLDGSSESGFLNNILSPGPPARPSSPWAPRARDERAAQLVGLACVFEAFALTSKPLYSVMMLLGNAQYEHPSSADPFCPKNDQITLQREVSWVAGPSRS